MFVVDAAILLSHPPRAVARVVGRLTWLPRWCAGLRRVRSPASTDHGHCAFTYAAAGVRLTLRASTSARGDDPSTAFDSGAPVVHVMAGDGLTLTWTLTAERSEDSGARAGSLSVGFPAAAGPQPRTLLRARVEVAIDPAHSLESARAVLCRTVARRVPADLERLGALLDRHEAERAALPPVMAGAPRHALHPTAVPRCDA